jgi:septum formation protein
LDSQTPVRLTLVSASPRRRELLAKLGIPFEVQPSVVAEQWAAPDGCELAEVNARRKVERSSWFGDRSRVLLGADTIVVFEHRLFGKPVGRESAHRMLTALSGRWHEVLTGVCLSGPALETLRRPPVMISTVAVSRVRFRDLSPAHIRSYLDSGEWRGKAGAYAIQDSGRGLVAELDGDFDNVVGLPSSLIHDLLTQHFSHCLFL